MIAYDCDGVTLRYIVHPRQNVDAQYYCLFLQNNLHAAVRTKLQQFMHNPPIILHDNARMHTAAAVADLFNRWDWEVLYHPHTLQI